MILYIKLPLPLNQKYFSYETPNEKGNQMPLVDMPLEKLQQHQGHNPMLADL